MSTFALRLFWTLLLTGTLLGTSSCGTTSVPGKESLAARVDRLFAAWNKPNSPGCALALIRDGRIVYKRGYGCANLEEGTPITPSTVFYIASLSKQFTAMSILLLAQQGNLSLDVDIRKYLPEVPDFGRTITVRHLIHHTSGLRDYEELLAMAGWRMDDVITREHMLHVVRNQRGLNFDPGAEYLYSNTGYCLLAEIVAHVSGQSFRAYAEAHIFKPLGMASTHFHDDHEMLVRNRAFSYRPNPEGGFKNAFNNASVVGGGGMYSSVEDLSKWVGNFEDGGVGGREILKQMYEPGVLNDGKAIRYAFGLAIDEYRGLKMIEHNGAFAGYRSEIIRFPDQKFAIVLLGNTSTIDSSSITREVADIFLFDTTPQSAGDTPKQKHSQRAPAKVDAANYDAFSGKFELKPGVVISVRRKGDRLMAQATGKPEVELVPEAETSFFVKMDESRVVFGRDNTGSVNRLTLFERSGSHVAQRLISLAADKLAEFVGEFHSDELQTDYSISIKNGELVAQHQRHGDIPLIQTSVVDNMVGQTWFRFHAAFVRNTKGQVVAFKLSGERSRNLPFLKRTL